MKKLLLLLIIVLLGVGIYNVWTSKQSSSSSTRSTVTIGTITYDVETADTDDERTKGLSGQDSLGSNQGMLFLFQEKNHHAFWMKDMRFPIDIIWIEDDTIVHIEENVPPPLTATYLPIYKPTKVANKVLEINAGEVKRNGFKLGDKVNITLLKSDN